MRNLGRIGLVLLLVVVGEGLAARAQTAQYFGRVTTGARSQVRSAPPAATRAAQPAAAASATLGRYSDQARAGAQAGVPRGSSWGQQAQPKRPAANVQTAQSRPHNYFPGMRSGRSYSRPVTLTATGGVGVRICTPGRGQVLAGGGGHR